MELSLGMRISFFFFFFFFFFCLTSLSLGIPLDPPTPPYELPQASTNTTRLYATNRSTIRLGARPRLPSGPTRLECWPISASHTIGLEGRSEARCTNLAHRLVLNRSQHAYWPLAQDTVVMQNEACVFTVTASHLDTFLTTTEIGLMARAIIDECGRRENGPASHLSYGGTGEWPWFPTSTVRMDLCTKGQGVYPKHLEKPSV